MSLAYLNLLSSEQITGKKSERYLVLHCPFAQVDRIVGVLWGPTVGRPEVSGLKPVEAIVVIPDTEDMLVNGEEVTVTCKEACQVKGFCGVL